MDRDTTRMSEVQDDFNTVTASASVTRSQDDSSSSSSEESDGAKKLETPTNIEITVARNASETQGGVVSSPQGDIK